MLAAMAAPAPRIGLPGSGWVSAGTAPFGGAASPVVGEVAGAVVAGAGVAGAVAAGAGADLATGTSCGAEPWSAAISRTRGEAAAAAAREGVCER